MDKDGSCLVMRIGRKHGRRSELWLSLRLPGVGILQSPIHPATTVYNTDSGHFEADGLRFECVEPHNTWRVMFNGLLRLDNMSFAFKASVYFAPSCKYQVILETIQCSSTFFISFTVDLDKTDHN